MSNEEYAMSYEDRLLYMLGPIGLTLDDTVLSNGKLNLTPRVLLTSCESDADRDRFLYTLAFNIAKGHNVRDCLISTLKLLAQEGKLKL